MIIVDSLEFRVQSDISHTWPQDEGYEELVSQIRRSSNSAPANLAEKHDGNHVRNKIEGVNRGWGEALAF